MSEQPDLRSWTDIREGFPEAGDEASAANERANERHIDPLAQIPAPAPTQVLDPADDIEDGLVIDAAEISLPLCDEVGLLHCLHRGDESLGLRRSRLPLCQGAALPKVTLRH
jgi:hypothetical protein